MMQGLVAILKLLKDPKALLPDLLDVICERFTQDDRYLGHAPISVSCPCQSEHHLISLPGFLMLEEVEGAFGTTVQRLESINAGGFLGGEVGEPLGELSLLAVSSRVSRQAAEEQQVAELNLAGVAITSRKSAKAFFSLLQARPRFPGPLEELEVSGLIGGEGWEFVAKALQFQPQVVMQVTTSKMGLGEGRRPDIKDIWDAIGPDGFCIELCCYAKTVWQFARKYGEGGWEKVEQILDMTEDEWVAQAEKPDEVEVEAGDFEEGDGYEEEPTEEGEAGGRSLRGRAW